MVKKAMCVIGVTGMRASGKGLFSEVARKLKIPVFEMRDVVYEMMKKSGLRLTNRSVRDFATNLRKRYGYGIVAKKTVKKLKTLKGRAVVVNGIRGLEELKVFKKHFGNRFSLVSIYSPPILRFRRVLKRSRPEDPKTWKEFEWADKKELDWGVAESVAMADRLIVNTGKKSLVKHEMLNILRRFR